MKRASELTDRAEAERSLSNALGRGHETRRPSVIHNEGLTGGALFCFSRSAKAEVR